MHRKRGTLVRGIMIDPANALPIANGAANMTVLLPRGTITASASGINTTMKNAIAAPRAAVTMLRKCSIAAKVQQPANVLVKTANGRVPSRIRTTTILALGAMEARVAADVRASLLT